MKVYFIRAKNMNLAQSFSRNIEIPYAAFNSDSSIRIQLLFITFFDFLKQKDVNDDNIRTTIKAEKL